MNVKEFKSWLSRNVGLGGKRPKTDEFNKSFKGKERNPSASEYPCKDVPEYHHYPEYLDLRKEDDDKKQEEEFDKNQDNNSRNNSSSQGAGRVAQSVARNIIPRVALAVVGSVVIVVAYNEIKAKQAAAAVTTTSWSWSEDGSTATLSYWNNDGDLVKVIPATVVTDEEATIPATCTNKGQMVYIATVKDADKTLTDTHTIEVAALGHSFDAGTESVVGGDHVITYECDRCHEEFVIVVSTEEIDPSVPKYLANWKWSEDHLSCDVELANKNGKVIKQGSATVVHTTTEATCTKEGLETYVATYVDGLDTYKETYSETIPMLEHTFDEGTETIINGKPSIIYVCSSCHQEFIVSVDIEEDDDENPKERPHFKALIVEEHCHEHCHDDNHDDDK